MTATCGSIEAMGDEGLGDLLEPIRERNRGRMVERLGRVRAWITDENGGLPSEQVRGDLHALVGALGTYGWSAGSTLLARIQAELTAGRSATEYLPELDQVIADVAGPAA